MERSSDSSVIDQLGGTVKVAEIFELSPQAVSQWRTAGIPRARRMYLRLLRPDLAPLLGRQAACVDAESSDAP